MCKDRKNLNYEIHRDRIVDSRVAFTTFREIVAQAKTPETATLLPSLRYP